MIYAILVGFVIGLIYDQLAWGLIGGLLVGIFVDRWMKKKEQ